MERVFYLGGVDKEMREIIRVLSENNLRFYNKNLKWGAKRSDYSDLFTTDAEMVFVELNNDMPQISAVDIDHHGERAGEPASLIQVLNLLGIKPTKEQMLIAAHDSEGWRGLVSAGMSHEDAKRWIYPDGFEKSAIDMFNLAWERRCIIGGTTIIEMPSNEATLASVYFAGMYDSILFFDNSKGGVGEANFFDDANKVMALEMAFPGGWRGGSGLFNKAIKSCFWGNSSSNINDLKAFLNGL